MYENGKMRSEDKVTNVLPLLSWTASALHHLKHKAHLELNRKAPEKG
jgi:hypothetical protein